MPFDDAAAATPGNGTAGSSAADTLEQLRALSHPLRLRIVDALESSGPLTATQVAAQLEDTPSNCSFHLRVLARAGLVVEAPGGKGRARPWQLVPRDVDVRIDDLDAGGRDELRLAVAALADRFKVHALAWLDHREGEAQEWRDAATSRQLLLRMTAAELSELNGRLTDLLRPYVERDEDPADARGISLTLATVPILPPTD